MRPEPNLDRYRFEVGRADGLFRSALVANGGPNGLRAIFDSITEVATLFYPVSPAVTGCDRPIPASSIKEAMAGALAEPPKDGKGDLGIPAAYVAALGTGRYDLVQSVPAAEGRSDESRSEMAFRFVEKARCLARALEPAIGGFVPPTPPAEPEADFLPDLL